MVWVPRRPELGELTEVDPDVEPVGERRRDLGVPDALWWAAATAAGAAAAFALLDWLAPRAGARRPSSSSAPGGAALGVFAASARARDVRRVDVPAALLGRCPVHHAAPERVRPLEAPPLPAHRHRPNHHGYLDVP
jgi:hypothetical protein